MCDEAKFFILAHLSRNDTTIDDRAVSILHVKTTFCKLIVSVIFTTGTFYETSDIFSLRQKRQL